MPLWGRQIPYTMMKFACFERTVEALYRYVVPKKRDDCSKPEQLVVTFAAGYIGVSSYGCPSIVIISLFAHLSVCPFVCLSICLSVCLCLFVCMCVYLSVQLLLTSTSISLLTAGIFCALVSHPADSIVSKLNSDSGSTMFQAARDLGFKGKTIFDKYN